MPLIATFRTRKSGGSREKRKDGYVENLIAAAEEGFDYVDVEIGTRDLRHVINKIHRIGAKTIVSHHDFQKTPTNAQLDTILRLCRASGAEIPKIVTTARKLEDNLRLLAFTQKASKDGSVICFGMGRIGTITRVLSPVYGATFTFASLDDEAPVAPGQISVQRMRRIYNEMGYS
jgi:3-dehydroquinate dehydratase type I